MKKTLLLMAAWMCAVSASAVSVADVSGGYKGSLTIAGESQGTKTVYLLPCTETSAVTFVLPDFQLNGASLGDIVLVNIPMSTGGELTLTQAPLYIRAIATRAHISVLSSSLTTAQATLSLEIHVDGLDNPIQVHFSGARVNDNYAITNGGFEGTWTDNEPTGWHSFGSATGDFASFVTGNTSQFTQSTDVRPGTLGSHSACISSKSMFSVVANGNCTNGQINAGSMSASDGTKNYNFSAPSNSGYNTAFVGQPDSIVFWAKYVPSGAVTDAVNKAGMTAAITTNSRYQDPEDGLDATNRKIASAQNHFAATASKGWQRLATPFTYTAVDPNSAAYILLTFTTNAQAGKGSNGDAVYLDDVEMIYNHALTQFKMDGATIRFTNGAATTDEVFSDSLHTFAATTTGRASSSFVGYDHAANKVYLYVLPGNYTQSKNYDLYTLLMAAPATDEQGTDTPGTDTPGTDTPGTDIPGTDEPEQPDTCQPTIIEVEKTITAGVSELWETIDLGTLPIGTFRLEANYNDMNGCDSIQVLNLIVEPNE